MLIGERREKEGVDDRTLTDSYDDPDDGWRGWLVGFVAAASVSTSQRGLLAGV